jgi:hypothetical protein
MLIHVQSSNIPIVRKATANANCTSLLSTLLPAWKQRSVLVSRSRPHLMTFINCPPCSSQRCIGVCSVIWWQSLIKTRPASRLREQTNSAQLPWPQSPPPPHFFSLLPSEVDFNGGGRSGLLYETRQTLNKQ